MFVVDSFSYTVHDKSRYAAKKRMKGNYPLAGLELDNESPSLLADITNNDGPSMNWILVLRQLL